MLKFISSLFILFISANSVLAQSKWIPLSFRAGTEIPSLIGSFLSDNVNRYELNGDVSFNNYRHLLSVDYGYLSRRNFGEDFNYSISGSYFRVGPDINILKIKDPDDKNITYNDPDNVVFVGVRYCRSYFSQTLNYVHEDPIYGSNNLSLTTNGVNGRWLEGNFGMKIKVLGDLYLGYIIHYKFARKVNEVAGIRAYELPGYGIAANNSLWTVSYHAWYRLPFRKSRNPQ